MLDDAEMRDRQTRTTTSSGIGRGELELHDGDIVPLAEFPLAARWIARRASEGETPATLRPLSQRMAAQSARLAAERRAQAGGDVRIFRADDDPARVRSALESLDVPGDTAIVISWNATTAALAEWRLFLARWGDVCYPMRDDVTIWAPGADWTLAYERFEVFRVLGLSSS